MGFNASQFRSRFNTWSRPASANKFEVIIERIPTVLEGKLTPKEIEVFNNIRYRIQTADIPARSFETQERRINGPQRLMPFGLIYTTEQVEIIEDEDGTIKKIFDKWHSAVFNQINSYKVAYYDDVVSDMFVRTFNSAGVATSEIKFLEAYPVSVAPAQLSWQNNDSILVIPVEFVYREWRIVK